MKKKGRWRSNGSYEIKGTLQGYFDKLVGHRRKMYVGKKRGGDILKVFTK